MAKPNKRQTQPSRHDRKRKHRGLSNRHHSNGHCTVGTNGQKPVKKSEIWFWIFFDQEMPGNHLKTRLRSQKNIAHEFIGFI